MKGTEKQKDFARTIMTAIEDADAPAGTDPKSKLDARTVQTDKAAVELYRAADDGAGRDKLINLFESIEDADSNAWIERCLDPATLEPDAGKIIDEFKGRYYKMYSDDGRLNN